MSSAVSMCAVLMSVLCSELETFMRKHEMEKAQLVERMNEQSQTVHHLTHHVHLLQSAQAELGNTTLPSTDIDLPAGTFGGQYPLFFKHSEENKVPSGDSGAADLWPLSDHIEQVNGANMSQLSASLGPDISFSTAPPPTRSGHYINPTHPATAVKGGMHGLQNDGMFQRCISRDALVMPEGAHRGTTVKTDEKTNQVTNSCNYVLSSFDMCLYMDYRYPSNLSMPQSSHFTLAAGQIPDGGGSVAKKRRALGTCCPN